MSDNFKTVTLDNGNTFAYYPTDSELTILPNGDYFCSSNNCLCFERPSHSYIIKVLKPTGSNITVKKFYKKI